MLSRKRVVVAAASQSPTRPCAEALPIKVLLVEGDPGHARVILELLSRITTTRFALERVEGLEPALARLRDAPVDVVLVDLALSDSRSQATLGAVQDLVPDVPIIVLTGLGDEDLGLRMVHAGAQDCLVKGQADGPTLGRAIRYAIERQRLRIDLRSSDRRWRATVGALAVANRELESFTYSVSHDLRTPLRHVSGFVRILVDEFHDALDPKARHYLNRIEDGTLRMGQLVDALLSLARVDQRELHACATPLTPMVERIIVALKADTTHRRIDWRVGALPVVGCDAPLMEILFTNLLSNAVKYTRPREHALIEVGQATRDGAPVLFVRDNGVGFDMKYSDRLFGVFQRLHRAEDFEGTGIGLATVHRIIHKHGWKVWAEAGVERGAVFFFTIAA